MFALDFDGLICDGLAECLLVTWNGAHDLPMENFSAAGLDRIPASFAEAFVHSRSFARHLGHFIVAFAPHALAVTSQVEFERCYESFAAGRVEDFVTRVSRYRERARQEREGDWVKHHVLYPGMREFLLPRANDVYIVTAKDAGSVTKILASAGVQIDAARVFGERREKNTALREIASREGVAAPALCLVDDNLLNVIDARSAGFDGVWATWGYSAPAHHRLAAERGVPSQSLETFLAGAGERVTMRFLHCMLRVRDVEETLDFYCGRLGLALLRRKDYPQGRFTLLFLAASKGLNGGPEIELTFNWDGRSYTGGTNFGHLAFAVPDLYATCARLQREGVKLLRPPRDGKMAFIKDPNGISIELLQEGPPLPGVEPWLSMPNEGTW